MTTRREREALNNWLREEHQIATSPEVQLLTSERAKPRCPWCDKQIDGVTHVGNEHVTHPKDGDLSVCDMCGGLLVFAKAGTQIDRLTPEELEQVRKKDPALVRTLEVVQAQIQRRAAHSIRVNPRKES